MSPIQALLRSRKFWLMVMYTVTSLALHFAGKYAPAGVFEDVQLVVDKIQAVVIAVIVGITIEDSARALSTRERIGG